MTDLENTCKGCKIGNKVVELKVAGDGSYISLIMETCTGCSRNPINQVLEGQIISSLFGGSTDLEDRWEAC
jgi:hypothetical protein